MYTYIFNWMSEVFPTQIRGASSGIITAIARFVGASSALIKLMLSGTAIELIVPCTILSAIMIPVAFTLPETIDRKIE